jgi:sulfopropanediol 3-dehydrogenase
MISYLKTASRGPVTTDANITATVADIIGRVEREGEPAVRAYSHQFDGWSPDRFTVDPEVVRRAGEQVPDVLRHHIDLAAAQIRQFAAAQRAMFTDLEITTLPGVVLGHRHVPVASVGAYVPGGRYPLVASALMTAVVASEAGVERIVACAPPHNETGIDPAMLYAMHIGGADTVLCVGGAQALAAMAFGIEDVAPVDMIVGAGNSYVAEAKRQLFGRVGIDLLAGPTEILVIADATADPEFVAADIVGQLEHGPTSVGWLVSTSKQVAELASAAIERRIRDLPTTEVARDAWDAYGEIIVCSTDQEVVEVSDRLAAEHVEVHTADPEWYLEHLKNYGSLFLGDLTTVPYGDKGIGTNHVLPTAGAARYTGGLWVGKFLKTLTYQHVDEQGSAAIGPTIVAISEAEQLPGHARSAQERLDRIHQAV